MKGYLIAIFACFALLALADAAPRWNELSGYTFEQYLADFGKHYSADEYAYRNKLFAARLNDINRHNSDKTKTWKNGVNKFTDMTEKEFRKLLGYKKGSFEVEEKYLARDVEDIDLSALPASVDWRTKGVVTAVKDQGGCGSCWTFGSAETIESHYALSTGQLHVLSEQQILDCTPNPNDCGGTGGCGGGTPELAFAQIIALGGLSTEWTYPYISYAGNNYDCKTNTSEFTPVAKLSSYQVLTSNQYSPVMNAIANIGPLAINVAAEPWMSYESGVFNGCDYNSNIDIDHVVQLVGYGTDSQYGDYWLVRNSWSPAWGELGYIRLARSSSPQCGTDSTPQDGTGCNGGPSQVTVCGTCGILYDVSYPVIA